MTYAQTQIAAIKAHTKTLPECGYDPRHVEAYMRNKWGTLDALSADQFRTEALIATVHISADGRAMAERLTQSYGL